MDSTPKHLPDRSPSPSLKPKNPRPQHHRNCLALKYVVLTYTWRVPQTGEGAGAFPRCGACGSHVWLAEVRTSWRHFLAFARHVQDGAESSARHVMRTTRHPRATGDQDKRVHGNAVDVMRGLFPGASWPVRCAGWTRSMLELRGQCRGVGEGGAPVLRPWPRRRALDMPVLPGERPLEE